MSAVCNFCGTKYSDPDICILESDFDDVYICEECINNAYECVKDYKLRNSEQLTESELVSPRKIKELLDGSIIGQELAKKRISTAIYNHYRTINNEDIEKANILLVGPTGSGKTAMLRAVSKELNVPLFIEDLSSVTSAGYSGKDATDILNNLLEYCDFDIKKAERAIVLLDEGDKIKSSVSPINNVKDVNGAGAQQSILKLVEGGIFSIEHPSMPNKVINIDTSKILFILAGAFSGIEDIIAKRVDSSKSTNSPFLSLSKDNSNKYNEYINKVKPEDIKEYGFIDELVGRFPVITPLKKLDVKALVEILTESKTSYLKQMQELFSLDNIELVFTEEAIKNIAKKAIEKNTGARGLKSVIEEVIEDAKFECPNSNVYKVIINDDLSTTYKFKKLLISAKQ